MSLFIGTLKAHFPSGLTAWGSPFPSCIPQMDIWASRTCTCKLVSELATRWAFFSTLQELIAWKTPKVTQRLSGKVTKAEASKAPGFHSLCSSPIPEQTQPELKHTDLTPWGSRGRRCPDRGLHIRAPLPLGSVSVVDPWASPPKFSVLIVK